jgi:hypothetical protein
MLGAAKEPAIGAAFMPAGKAPAPPPKFNPGATAPAAFKGNCCALALIKQTGSAQIAALRMARKARK